MKKVVIICSAGMSSSLMAKKTTTFFNEKGFEIEVTAVNLSEGNKVIESGVYELYLISPQTRMYFDDFAKVVAAVNKKIAIIPPQAYVPMPPGITKLADLIRHELEV